MSSQGPLRRHTDDRIHRFVANLTATVFMLLNLNSIMSVIFNVPAAIASTVSPFFFSLPSRVLIIILIIALGQIVACRAVRRLTNYSVNGPEL